MNVLNTWWSLIPPLIAILLALFTKEVYSSLFLSSIDSSTSGVLKFLSTESLTADGVLFTSGSSFFCIK